MTGFRGSSASGSGRPQRAQPGDTTGNARIVVPFEDNRRLTSILGEYDSNLALIEDRLGIEAHAHGNVVILTGPESGCQIARQVLEDLYQRAGKGETVGPGDFDGLIRHARQESSPGDSGAQAQIATRRRVIKARTPMQSNYMRAIQNTEIGRASRRERV